MAVERVKDLTPSGDIKLVGYHYTSLRNWQVIQQIGLIPYEIKKPELRQYFDVNPRGVWTWIEEPTGISEAGTVVYQVSTKGVQKVVKLSYEYTMEDTLKYNSPYDGMEHNVTLYHLGTIGVFTFHTKQPAHIITRHIKPEEITLVKTFDLEDIIKT